MIFLDLETTGFDPLSDEIIEFSAIKTNEHFEVIGEPLDFLVKPKNAIPAIVSQVTGIFDEDVKDALPIADRIEAIKEFLGDDTIVGHNIGFDLSFLNTLGIAQQNPSIDSCMLATLFLPSQKSYALEVLSEVFSIEHTYKHRALGDVLACRDLCFTIKKYAQALPTSFWEQFTSYEGKIDAILFSFLYTWKPFTQQKILQNIIQECMEYEKDIVLERSLYLAPSSLSLINAVCTTLREGGIVSAPRDFVQAYEQSLKNTFPDLTVYYAPEKYVSTEKAHTFKEKSLYTQEESILLLKLIRAESESQELTEYSLHIHWGDYPLFKKYLACTREIYKKEKQLEVSPCSLCMLDTIFLGTVHIPEYSKLLCIEYTEDELDKALTQTVYQTQAKEECSDALYQKLIPVFDSLTAYIVEDGGSIEKYGKSRVLPENLKDTFLLSSVPALLEATSIEEYPEYLAALFSLAHKDTTRVTVATVNTRGEVQVSFTQKKYSEMLNATHSQDASFAFIAPEASAQLLQSQLGRELQLQVSAYKAPISMPESTDPSPKNPSYKTFLISRLENIFSNSVGTIFVSCASKAQAEELSLYFMLKENTYSLTFLSSVLGGGKGKISHLMKQQKNIVLFTVNDFIKVLAFEGLRCDTLIVPKLPFDAPTALYKAREELLGNPFAEKVIPRLIYKITRNVMLTEAKECILLDSSIHTKWAKEVYNALCTQ